MDNPSAAFEAFAFSVVDSGARRRPNTFAETLATNMGLRYDWFTDNSTTPYTYRMGTWESCRRRQQPFRTLMADFLLCNAMASLASHCSGGRIQTRR
jgi:hypothetical protein